MSGPVSSDEPVTASGGSRVAILGGGMGGLSCAHELARRGVAVTVYEAGAHLGGKARSHAVPGTGREGRPDLPGEHGFRFYPGFYRHVIATMTEIPDPLSPTGLVSGNLANAPESAVAMSGRLVVTPRRPRGLADAVQAVAGVYRVGGTLGDLARYLGAHLKYLTTCESRREGELEALSWAAFIGAETPGRYQESFRQVLLACTRTMVAMHAERGSTRTLGRVSCLLMLDAFGSDDVDRTMMGPTTACWIEPWRRELTRLGVRFVLDARVTRLEAARGAVARAWVRTGGADERAVEADAFVLAVPLEAAHALVTPALAEADPALARLARLDVERVTNWMTGAQFFLREDVPLCRGHVFFPRSPWALTAISQGQFWNRGRRGMETYGDGTLRGILSVDVSDCFAPDRDGVRLVEETSRDAILGRVLDQVVDGLDPATGRALRRAVFAAHLDDELRVGPGGVTNTARLLVHPPGSWRDRPEATLAIGNLFLAADYVRTSIDLASMEGANEAGRRAARGVLHRLGLARPAVRLFDFEGLERFDLLRRVDGRLHAFGLPHLFDAAGSAHARLRASPAVAVARVRAAFITPRPRDAGYETAANTGVRATIAKSNAR